MRFAQLAAVAFLAGCTVENPLFATLVPNEGEDGWLIPEADGGLSGDVDGAPIVVPEGDLGGSGSPDLQQGCGPAVVRASCSEHLAAGCGESGVFKIAPPSVGETDVWCEMKEDGGGWVLVVRGVGGDASADYFTANELHRERATTFDGGTFKFSDDMINRIRNNGAYRVVGKYDLLSVTRFFNNSCYYSHNSVARDWCTESYSSANLTSGAFRGVAYNWHKALSNWGMPKSVVVVQDHDSYRGRFWVVSSAEDDTCDGNDVGCNVEVWVR